MRTRSNAVNGGVLYITIRFLIMAMVEYAKVADTTAREVQCSSRYLLLHIGTCLIYQMKSHNSNCKSQNERVFDVWKSCHAKHSHPISADCVRSPRIDQDLGVSFRKVVDEAILSTWHGVSPRWRTEETSHLLSDIS